MKTPLTAPYVLTRYDSFSVIQFDCPRAVELLAEYGLHCSSCALNEYDSVEIGVSRHGMSEEEMLEMLEEVNEQLALEWQEQKAKQSETAKTN